MKDITLQTVESDTDLFLWPSLIAYRLNGGEFVVSLWFLRWAVEIIIADVDDDSDDRRLRHA